MNLISFSILRSFICHAGRSPSISKKYPQYCLVWLNSASPSWPLAQFQNILMTINVLQIPGEFFPLLEKDTGYQKEPTPLILSCNVQSALVSINAHSQSLKSKLVDKHHNLCICTPMCLEAQDNLWHHFSGTIHCCFQTGSLIGLELAK